MTPQNLSGGAVASPPPRAPHTRSTPVVSRVLVKEVNWLGDLVMSLPALRAIRSAFSSASLAVLVRRELAGFFDGINWIEHVIPYTVRRGPRGLRDRWGIIGKIREHRFNLAILFPNSFASALWVTLAGVPRRAGYVTDARGFMLTHAVTTPPPDALEDHQSRYWLALVRETLGVAPVSGAEHYKLEVAERHREKMRAWLAANRAQPEAPLIALAPAAAYGPAKEWPLVRYSALVDLLAERFGAECVLVGAPSEQRKCLQVAATSRFGAPVAAGQTTVGELIGLLSVCDGFAGNDSGSMHLAAALGIPAVGIFGSTNPTRTGPLGPRANVIYHQIECSPCLARTCRFGHYNCLRGITPEEVAGALDGLHAFGS